MPWWRRRWGFTLNDSSSDCVVTQLQYALPDAPAARQYLQAALAHAGLPCDAACAETGKLKSLVLHATGFSESLNTLMAMARVNAVADSAADDTLP